MDDEWGLMPLPLNQKLEFGGHTEAMALSLRKFLPAVVGLFLLSVTVMALAEPVAAAAAFYPAPADQRQSIRLLLPCA